MYRLKGMPLTSIGAEKAVREYGRTPAELRQDIFRMRQRGVGWFAAAEIVHSTNAAIAGYRKGVELGIAEQEASQRII